MAIMSLTIEPLVEEALSLPSEARALLADRLVESLDFAIPAHLDKLWAAEARNRLAEVRSGQVQTISGDEAAARIRCAVGR